MVALQQETTARFAHEPPEFPGQCAAALSRDPTKRCRRKAKTGYFVCPTHGARTPRGSACGSWKHGGRCRYKTTGFVDRIYQRARRDPELTSCGEDAALIVALIQERYSRINESCSNKWWEVLAKARQKALAAKATGGTVDMAAAINELLDALDSGARFAHLA